MFESFVIMLREGMECALVLGIIVTLLKRSGRRDLMRPVWGGLGLAVLASVAAAYLLRRDMLPVREQVYEGSLYWASALFVLTMVGWIHRKAQLLKSDIETRVERAMGDGAGSRQAWAIGLFTFLMIFREGAETVLFLSAVHLTTSGLLSFAGTVLGLGAAVAFYLMFVSGSLKVNLRRFFKVTEWMLGIFVVQLLVNGYQEFSEIGAVPAGRWVMAFVTPVVNNNALFILALAALPLFIWLTREPLTLAAECTEADRRRFEASLKRERLCRFGAVAASLGVIAAVGLGLAKGISFH